MWGFATTVLHLATGHLPYQGLHHVQIVSAMLKKRLPEVFQAQAGGSQTDHKPEAGSTVGKPASAPSSVNTAAGTQQASQRISPGSGEYPKKGQTVSVHYVGTLQNGKEFDSSRKRGQPLNFKLGQGQVIKAWDEGIIQLSKGERAKLICSPNYAYGSNNVGNGLIPPNSTLIFDVELVNFE
ncbi:hypothetical protein WJX82_010359 [Trebouxia sp. C0006]